MSDTTPETAEELAEQALRNTVGAYDLEAVAYVAGLIRERDDLRAALARVEALCDEAEEALAEAGKPDNGFVQRLRAALAGPEATEQTPQVRPPRPPGGPACNCAHYGSAALCPVHTQADYDAEEHR